MWDVGDAAGVTVESFGAIFFFVFELGPHDPYGGVTVFVGNFRQ